MDAITIAVVDGWFAVEAPPDVRWFDDQVNVWQTGLDRYVTPCWRDAIAEAMLYQWLVEQHGGPVLPVINQA